MRRGQGDVYRIGFVDIGLEPPGLTFADIVKCTVKIDETDDWSDFNAVYAEYS